MSEFKFNPEVANVVSGLCDSLKLLYKTQNAVIVCVGTDLVVGDSLGPIIGSNLFEKLNGKAYVYGTLESPITAKEVEVVCKTVKRLHPSSKVLVIDAAVGQKEDVGTIKVMGRGIKPGLGVNKDLSLIGDVSIIAIVNDKNCSHDSFYLDTRFSLIYKLSNFITLGILKFFN